MPTYAETAGSESEDRYRLIFQGSADGMLRVDHTGRVTDINERLGDMLGADVARHIGLPLSAFRRFFVADGGLVLMGSTITTCGRDMHRCTGN